MNIFMTKNTHRHIEGAKLHAIYFIIKNECSLLFKINNSFIF